MEFRIASARLRSLLLVAALKAESGQQSGLDWGWGLGENLGLRARAAVEGPGSVDELPGERASGCALALGYWLLA
jgi:hypothetical protein